MNLRHAYTIFNLAQIFASYWNSRHQFGPYRLIIMSSYSNESKPAIQIKGGIFFLQHSPVSPFRELYLSNPGSWTRLSNTWSYHQKVVHELKIQCSICSFTEGFPRMFSRRIYNPTTCLLIWSQHGGWNKCSSLKGNATCNQLQT